jgi:trimeric autotransporter adhesin
MKTSGYLRLLAAVWLSAVILMASEQHGQVTFGGLPIPGVSVTATKGENKATAITDGMGGYSFPDLADGVWTIQVEMSGFTTLKQDVTVAAGGPGSTFELKLKSLSEMQAQVQAPVLAAARPAPGTPAAAKPAAPAPAKPKPAAQTAATPAAAAGAPAQTAAAPPAAGAAAPPGAPAEANSQAADGFLVNGSQVNGGASPFALNPAFGNNRRGPRSLYTYSVNFGNVTLSELNARPFSQTGQLQPKAQTTAYTIQGTVQGPLRIPRILKNGPTFGINFAIQRGRTPNTDYALVPTKDQRSGDLSSITAPILNPVTQTPFTGNMIPQSQISPQATALLAYYPLPNFSSTRYNYQIPVVAATNGESLNTRLQKQIGRKNSILGTFAFNSTRASNPSVFGFLDTSKTLGLNIRPQWNHQFTNRLSSQLSYQFTRNASHQYSFFENTTNVSGLAGIAGNLQSPAYFGPPNLNFSTGILGLTDGTPSFNRPQTSLLGEQMTWNHGRHTVQFGGDFRRQEFNYFGENNPRGTLGFTGAATAVPGIPGSGSDFADFLLGIPDSSTIAYGNADKYLRASTYDAFINDDWRVNSALTLNGGLRWDYSAPVSELYGRLVNLDVAPGFTAAQPVLGTDPVGPVTGQNYPSALVHPDWRTFEPRIGLAWRPISGSSLVIRAGYGLSYLTSVYTAIAQSMDQQSPLSKSFTVQNSPVDPLTLANPFIPAANSLTTSFGVDPNFKVGNAQTWTLSLQKDLPWGMQMQANYTGVKGTRLTQEFYPNTYPYGGTSPCATCPVGFIYETSNGDSTRNAGAIQLRRRLHAGFLATGTYTYAKAFDDTPAGAAQNWLNLSGERGLSNFDQRQNVNVLLQYTSGMGIGGGTFLTGWRAAVIKEWTLSVPIIWGTGLPENPNYNQNVGGTGFSGPLRPDFTGAALYAAPAGLALNPLAFGAPPLGVYGNAGRNSITGPDQFSLNASASRTFRMNDRTTATLSVNSTNTLNHPVPSSYGVTYGSPQLGVVSFPSGGMRAMLTTLRFNF